MKQYCKSVADSKRPLSLSYDLIIIGAGAAGLMCAATAGQRGQRVLLLDHAPRLAEKIRISGGGRCNFTNRDVSAAHYLSHNPHFVRSALARYGAADFIELVRRHGIAFHERKWGQLFCDDSAQQIIDMLRNECEDGQVDLRIGVEVHAVAKADSTAERFIVRTSIGSFSAHRLVIASGGLSIPKIGASPLGYRIAEQFGVPVIAPQPALVPLALPGATLSRLAPLAGISLDLEAQCNGPSFREAGLITHRGLSGPAILQVSSYWQAQLHHGQTRAAVSLRLLPDLDVGAWLAERASSRSLLSTALAELLPRRFAQAWCALHGWTQALHSFDERQRTQIAASLTAWQLQPSGTLGYAKAEATLGGVDSRALSSKTMEARHCPGLYFIGEVVDVTGHLGGYNFQWAWSSAVACAQSL